MRLISLSQESLKPTNFHKKKEKCISKILNNLPCYRKRKKNCFVITMESKIEQRKSEEKEIHEKIAEQSKTRYMNLDSHDRRLIKVRRKKL